MVKRILIVDDQKLTREFLIDALSTQYDTDEAEDLAEALKKLGERTFDLILTDVKMNSRDEGLELLKVVRKRKIDTMVVVMTGYASIEQATDAMRLGAYNYIEKPFTIDEIKIKLRKALEYKSLKMENRHLKKKLDISTGKEIIGCSENLRKIMNMVDMIAGRCH